jgi:transposase-like protein
VTPWKYAPLLAHARKFGVECVYETAVDGRDETDPDLRRLRIELDAIEANRPTGLRGLGRPSRRRRVNGETAEAVQQLAAEGLVVSAIADKLGVTDATVRRHLGRNGRDQSRKPAWLSGEICAETETRVSAHGAGDRAQQSAGAQLVLDVGSRLPAA